MDHYRQKISCEQHYQMSYFQVFVLICNCTKPTFTLKRNVTKCGYLWAGNAISTTAAAVDRQSPVHNKHINSVHRAVCVENVLENSDSDSVTVYNIWSSSRTIFNAYRTSEMIQEWSCTRLESLYLLWNNPVHVYKILRTSRTNLMGSDT
jgi:hypothetical protein